jgi:hypothetical protein
MPVNLAAQRVTGLAQPLTKGAKRMSTDKKTIQFGQSA